MSGEYSYPLLGSFPVTSGIGPRWGTTHSGIDIGAPIGTPVVAPTDLEITRAQWGSTGGYGNVIYGVDANNNQYRFAHLSDIGVSVGDTISQGSIIGAVGNTGRSTGSHLHIEVRDAAGKLLKDTTNAVVNAGKKAINTGIQTAIMAAANTVPGVGAAVGIAGKLGVPGIGDGCGWICQLKKWLTDTDFFKRAGFVLVGLILIIGAITFFAKGEANKVIQEIVK